MNFNQNKIVGNKDWDGLSKPRLYIAMAALLCGLFFSVMDGTVANVALPILSEKLSVSPSSSIWIVNAFQLVIVMLLLPFAALGELIGFRRIYLWGLLLFTFGSLFCALSPSFLWLVGARVVQGIGAAMVMSVNTSLVKLIYPKRHLGKGIGLNATVVALGLVVGPAFTGAILAVASWQWLFIVNLPFGLVAWALARRSLPDNPTQVVGRKFDLKEALLNALSFGLLIGSLEAYSHKAPLEIVVVGIVLFVLVTWSYVRNQSRKPFPMLPIDLIRNPIFSLSILTSIVSFASQMLALIAMPFILSHNYHYEAVEIGLLMSSYPIVILFVAPLSGFLINRIDPEILGCFGLLMLSIGSFLLASTPEGSDAWQIIARFAICGIGFGFFQSPNNHLIISSAPVHRAGSASGMMASARLVGQTSGAACVALSFHLFGDRGPFWSIYFAAILSLLGMIATLVRYQQSRQQA